MRSERSGERCAALISNAGPTEHGVPCWKRIQCGAEILFLPLFFCKSPRFWNRTVISVLPPLRLLSHPCLLFHFGIATRPSQARGASCLRPPIHSMARIGYASRPRTYLFVGAKKKRRSLATRYFCEHDDKKAHRKWEPHAESEGICESAGLSDLSEAPFPPKFKVLFYGNSHMRQVSVVTGSVQRSCRGGLPASELLPLCCWFSVSFCSHASIILRNARPRMICGVPPSLRVHSSPSCFRGQVVEAMMCQFPKEVLFKRMKYTGGGISGVRTIDGEVACRACHTPEDEAAVVGHDCIPEHDVVSEACR